MSIAPFQRSHLILVLESMGARKPGLQAPSSLTGLKIKSTHIVSLLIFFSEICRTSNIGKSNRHIGCLNSEVKAIKPTISNLSQTTHLRRLRATLNFGWQAPEGILEPGPVGGSHQESKHLNGRLGE